MVIILCLSSVSSSILGCIVERVSCLLRFITSIIILLVIELWSGDDVASSWTVLWFRDWTRSRFCEILVTFGYFFYVSDCIRFSFPSSSTCSLGDKFKEISLRQGKKKKASISYHILLWILKNEYYKNWYFTWLSIKFSWSPSNANSESY